MRRRAPAISGDDAAARHCPFCAGREGETPPELLAFGRPPGAAPDTPGWSVRVVPNKYPALEAQEVVVHGPEHLLSLADVDAGVAGLAVRAWSERLAAQRAAGAACVLLAVNEGKGSGASLEHTHSQVIPFAFVPPAIAAELAGFAAGCPLCDPALREPAHLVREAAGIATFCPPWSAFPYETWLAPTAHEPELSAADPGALAAALLHAVRRLRAVLGRELAWNAIVHTAPFAGEAAAGAFHWHVEIVPRLATIASVELGAGVWINMVAPERAAAELRAAAGAASSSS